MSSGIFYYVSNYAGTICKTLVVIESCHKQANVRLSIFSISRVSCGPFDISHLFGSAWQSVC